PAPNRLAAEPTPSRSAIRDWLAATDERPRMVPIYREIMADAETPVSAFTRIQQGRPGFILESVEGGERIARYSFIGAGPFGQIRLDNGDASITINGATEQRTYA